MIVAFAAQKALTGLASASGELHHGAEAAQRAAGEKRIVRGTNQANRNVISRVTVPRNVHVSTFRAAGQQSRGLHVIARNRFANFLKHRRRRLVMKCLAKTHFFQLMRQNPPAG